MFSFRLLKMAVLMLLAGVLAGAMACNEPQMPGAGPVAKATQPAKVDPLDRCKYEDQWQKFYQDAVTHYGLTDVQVASADAVLRSCLTRASDRRERGQAEINQARQKKEAGAEQKAREELQAALDKLDDECLGRIEAVASIEQINKAEKAGFESPMKKRPRVLPEVGYLAPPFELKGADGKPVSLASLRGKVVILHFWATWCGFCKKSMPEIQNLQEAVKDKPDVVLLGINASQRPNNPDPVAFAKEQGCTYTILVGGDSVSGAYQVQGFPTMYVIGRDGSIIHKERGAQPEVARRLMPLIEKALAEPAKPKGV